MSDSIANGGCCSGSVRPGTYGNAVTVAQITVDKCGRITKISNVAITGGGGGSSQWTGTTGSPIYYVPNVGIGSSATPTAKLQVTGNVYISNALTTTNVFASRYYGDGGLLSNISSSAITQPFANLVVSNSVTTTNVFATGTSNLTNVNVQDTFNVLGSVTANAANATFFFDTFTIPYINTQTLDVSSTMNFTGQLATISNLYVPGNANIEYLSVSNLSVTGNLYVTATNVQTTNALTINNSGTMTAFKVTQNETSIHTHNVAEFWDASVLAMVIDPEGNVGIHTTSSPGYALTVTDPVNFETLYIRGNDGLTTLKVNGNVYASNAVTTTNVFATSVSVGDTMTIAGATGQTSLKVTGNINASTSITGVSIIGTHYGIIAGSNTIAASSITASGNITSLSDERLKKNIRHIENPLEKIKKVNGYLFQRTDIDGDFTGVLAQEFIDVLPEVVQMDKDGVYSVSYGNIVALLIEALKEETRLREKLAAQLNIQ
jgi:hypothetical protein